MTIITVIVTGTLTATIVLAIHCQKHRNRPLSRWLRQIVHNWFVDTFILRPPCALTELWHEFGVIEERRVSMSRLDPLLLQHLDPISHLPPRPRAFFGSISSNISDTSSLSYITRLATLTRQYTSQVREKERERQASIAKPLTKHARSIKRHKMARRCALEWEYLANVIDRVLLISFSFITLNKKNPRDYGSTLINTIRTAIRTKIKFVADEFNEMKRKKKHQIRKTHKSGP
ncbi:hypothetical protein DICVIV_07333 [Dictyocaulus viviparus]|uniref:Uncharacterized protein n=1 Tax=Dictyocaulus viviparus TaxID=29172 RepID=A0A0D8XPK9_DICVI|nr:hypothetical protein DICVIV_07333 [Dictyocaulus viviparus]